MNVSVGLSQFGVTSLAFARRLALVVVAFGAAQAPVAAATAPSTLLLSGNAKQIEVDPGRLPAGTDVRLFGTLVAGDSFGIYAREIPAGDYVIELGFVETEATGADLRVFALEANGVPLDARLDVWKQAGGAFKPWVLKSPCTHAGGMFGLSFTGLNRPAMLSFARLTRVDGTLVASGAASDWKKSDRLKMLDARSQDFRPVRVGETPFFNVDHSPVGTWASFVYGMEASGGLQMSSSPAKEGYLMPHNGVVVAVKRGADVRVMPFYVRPPGNVAAPKMFSATEVRHTIGAATDQWQLPDGVSWTHYTPSWDMPDWDRATDAERRRFVLPATWLTFTLDNRASAQPLELAFGVQQPTVRAREWPGFDGFVVAEDHALAVRSGEAELLDGGQVKQDFGLEGATGAFRVRVAPGAQKTVTFVVAHHRTGDVAKLGPEPLQLAHAAMFRDKADVIVAADAALPGVVARCQVENRRIAAAGLSAERAFLSAEAIHSYQFNTVLFLGAQTRQPVWVVVEGEYRLLNTLDLVVDHVFYELATHPWTVRNELDVYLEHYSFVDDVARPNETTLHPGGLGFFHDMGSGFAFADPAKGQAYTALMTQEELQNWLISAALYWHATHDDAWLASRRDALQRGLASMLLRDDIDPTKRDGITSYRSMLRKAERRRDEITTYDAMDHSLQQPTDSLYITVKSFGTYLVLEPVFRALGESDLAAECAAAVLRTERGLLAHWDEKAKCFPAVFDTESKSRIIPAVEGLIYPFAMGLGRAVAVDGPHGALIAKLKQHMETVLVPGVCLDARTGGWILSDTSNTTWQSKVYLNQFVAETVLGLHDERVRGKPDAAHYAYQVLGSPAVGWTCQIFTRELTAFGCRHYPRGVTSALWWLPSAAPAPSEIRSTP